LTVSRGFARRVVDRRQRVPLKREGSMSWNWRDLVVLTFLVFLFGAAMLANVSDGPLHEHRGSWVTHALR